MSFRVYPDMITCLFDRIFALEREDPDSSLWVNSQTLNLLLFTQDFFGIKRALGGTFFAANGFTAQRQIEFSRISQTGDELFSIIQRMIPKVDNLYSNVASDNRDLLNELNTLEDKIEKNDSGSATSDSVMGLIWFQNMTQYMGIVGSVAKFIRSELYTDLQSKIDSYDSEQQQSWILVGVVLTICPIMAITYIQTTRRLMKAQKKFTAELQEKIIEMKQEKSRTDRILQTMLPKSIAESLRDNGSVTPQQYDSATVFFSDLVGFTTVCSAATPIQIVAMLNELYTRCDDILDRYDAYKVETIGDAYVVVSGVPNTNQGRHSAEMASVSLEIIMMTHEYRIPHNQKRLFMRVGLHTGAVVAGVVGQKMPRYCLFGDTMTIANAMESSGLPLRVQISAGCHKHLMTYSKDQFTCTERGDTLQKDGSMEKTYWLLGRKDMPFAIDLEEAEAIYQAEK